MAQQELPVHHNHHLGFTQNPIDEGIVISDTNSNPNPLKKKRNLPGTPDPEAEVIALSPKTLMATNRFLCEICGKGFQRDQNLQLHRRGHNLPWKLKQRSGKEAKKRVYVCPEKSCVHNHPSRALGDLTGIKKHFCRKHGEKKWKCDKCSKRYAVQSDWKAHSKTCGTREYKCDCGTLFSRRDSFITHRAFCDALAEETARVKAASSDFTLGAYHFIGASQLNNNPNPTLTNPNPNPNPTQNPARALYLWMGQQPLFADNPNPSPGPVQDHHPPSDYHDDHQMMNWVFGREQVRDSGAQALSVPSLYSTNQTRAINNSHEMRPLVSSAAANMSATALLQKAAEIGATSSETSFLGTFGLKCNNNNSINSINGNQGHDGNTKSCGLYGLSANNADDLDGDLPIYPPAKRRHVGEDGGAGGHTRDFLGVGVQTISHQAPINGWI